MILFSCLSFRVCKDRQQPRVKCFKAEHLGKGLPGLVLASSADTCPLLFPGHSCSAPLTSACCPNAFPSQASALCLDVVPPAPHTPTHPVTSFGPLGSHLLTVGLPVLSKVSIAPPMPSLRFIILHCTFQQHYKIHKSNKKINYKIK